MRLKIVVRLAKIVLFVLGVCLSGAAIFAVQIGLDNDPGWGMGRSLLAASGCICLAGAVGLHYGRSLVRQRGFKIISGAVRQIGQVIGASRPMVSLYDAWRRLSGQARGSVLAQFFVADRRRSVVLFAGSSVALVLFVYLWYITSGTLTVWTPYTNYFDMLGSAFHSGQLSLLEQPSAELMALENPYDWRAREGVPHIWDVTLYQGKYYLYWGPVPGLLAAAVKAIAPVRVDDQYLCFFFCCGQVIFFALLVVRLREYLFPVAPSWTLPLMILLGGLSTPVLWLINRPSVYEAAIAGGQFFLLTGLYAAGRAFLFDKVQKGWLAACGFSWGAAVGCRMNLAVAVLFFALLLTWILLRNARDCKTAVVQIMWLGLPAALWAAGLGWYNFARFGSVFEMGHRYQLTGMALPSNYAWVMSIQYAVPGLYNYLFRPLELSARGFPFVFAPYIQESMWPFFIHLPEHYYYSEPVAGIVMAVPGLLLGLLPAWNLLRWAWRWLHEQPVFGLISQNAKKITVVWLAAAGGFVLLLGLLSIFISDSMRYLADILWLGTLLAAIGLWYALSISRSRPFIRSTLAWMAVCLVAVSIALSLLVNFTNGDKRFETNNPALHGQIVQFFQHD